jgi:hypothetical protein
MKNQTTIFKTAWTLARQGQQTFGGKVAEYFAESLRIAHKGELKMEKTTEEKLIEIGGKKWEKHGKSRIYFNSALLRKIYGLACSSYDEDTKNIVDPVLNGETISNTQGYKLAMQLESRNFFYDLNDKKFISKNVQKHTLSILIDNFEKAMS